MKPLTIKFCEMKNRTKVQKIVMTCKSFCCAKKQKYNCNLYNKALRSFICVIALSSRGIILFYVKRKWRKSAKFMFNGTNCDLKLQVARTRTELQNLSHQKLRLQILSLFLHDNLHQNIKKNVFNNMLILCVVYIL